MTLLEALLQIERAIKAAQLRETEANFTNKANVKELVFDITYRLQPPVKSEGLQA